MAGVTVEQALALAVSHHQAGRLAEAEAIYRQVLAADPRHADAMRLLGALAHQTGHGKAGIELIRKAIALRPNFPEAYNNLGNILAQQREFDQATAAFGMAIQLKNDFADAHNNLGIVHFGRGQLELAIAAYRAAIGVNPDFAEAHFNLGAALHAQLQFEEAIAAYRAAIRLDPAMAKAQNNLGNALKDKGELDQAIAAFGAAIQSQPDYAVAHYNLGNALSDRGRRDEAIAAYRAAIRFQPDLVGAYNNLGKVLRECGKLDEAIAAYRTAIQLQPDLVEPYNNLGDALKDEGLLDEAIAAFRAALALKPDRAAVDSNLVYTLYFHPGYDSASIYREHRRWNDQHAEPLKHLIRPHGNDASPGRRLKIGYVSPDFCGHPVGFFMLPLLAAHDREKVEVFAYANVAAPDFVTERLRSYTDHWRDIVGMSDEQVAQLVREDGIDILVDLSLHMANNRMLVFARKPAPVQVTYLGYAGTTGLSTMDYRLSDPYLDPPGENDACYSERTFRLPETYWGYAPAFADIAVTPLPALRENNRGITFGSLNNFCKLTEPTLAAWCRLLRRVPNSRLIVHANEGGHRQRTLDTFAAAGVDPARVSFVGRLPIDAYYRQYDEIDIALDPFPYAGGTTTCDALWMGAAVVSLCGQPAVARGGMSVLSNVGLPELVAHTEDDYVTIAANLASDLPRLMELRATMRRRMEASPLMDGPRFARNIESAYRQMWLVWCESQ